ncbi:MAG: hypothetical protein Q8M01_04615 [Rubrivivax sp.]|nr:hypothetical protein [Rubrivivax sp.]
MPHRRTRPLTAAAVLAILLATWVLRVDDAALTQVDAGWKRALATFAAARALNAVISVAQGTELAVQPAGVGVTLAPGQVLDPVNDLIEQFSTLMLLATVAFGAQRVLIGIGAWWPLSLLLSALALAWAVLRWRGALPPRWLSQALVALLVVRFLVPAVALGSEAAFQLFLKDDYQAGQQTLEQSSSQIGQLSGPVTAAPADESMGERVRRWWAQGTDIGERFEALKAVANRAVEHVVRLIVVFTLQTLVLPLLLGWVLWRLARAVVAGGPPR